jgi:hypothetical protein
MNNSSRALAGWIVAFRRLVETYEGITGVWPLSLNVLSNRCFAN